MSTRDRILERVAQMPELPAATTRLIPLLQDSDADADDICEAVTLDMGLTAHVLRVANTAAFGCNAPITTVRGALMRLGTGRVLSAVLSSSVGAVAMGAVDGYGLEKGSLWEKCIAVALATEEFSQIMGTAEVPEAFTAGMLCDIGKIVIEGFLGQDASEVNDLAFGQGLPFDRAERDVMGVDHAEVGATLLRAWNLPESIVEVVRWHHEPTRCPDAFRGIVDLVHLADYACIMSGIGGGNDGTSYALSGDVTSRLGVSTFDIERAMCNTHCRLEEVRELFGLIARNVTA